MCLLVTRSVRSSDHEIYHLFDLFCLKKNSFSKAEQHIFVHLDNYLPRHQIRIKNLVEKIDVHIALSMYNSIPLDGHGLAFRERYPVPASRAGVRR